MSVGTREVSRRLTGLTVAASVLLTLSLMPVSVSVHLYCENWAIAAALAVGSMGVSLVLVFSRAQTRQGHVINFGGLIASFLAIAMNIAFIICATRLCRHMFDLLK